MPDNSSKEISIRESKGSITVSGIHEETVNTAAEMQRYNIKMLSRLDALRLGS
jgi:hypothetical protein